MNWFIFTLLSALFYTVSGLLTRKLLKGHKDSWAYSFWFSFLGTIVITPFIISDRNFPKEPAIWVMMIIMVAFVVFHNYLKNKAVNFIPPSVQGSVGKIRIVWIFIFGILLLEESFSFYKILGLIFAIFAGLLLFSSLKKTTAVKGIYLELLASIIYASIITSYGYFFKYFSVLQLTFLVFAFGTIINALIMPNWGKRIRLIFQENSKLVILSSVFAAFGYLFLNSALKVGEQSTIIVTSESFLVITFVAEYIYLKEKDIPLKKIIAVILAIVGAILVQIT